MGNGGRLDEWNAFPWAQRLSRHLPVRSGVRNPATGNTVVGPAVLPVDDWQTNQGGRVTFQTYDGSSQRENEWVTWSVEMERPAPWRV